MKTFRTGEIAAQTGLHPNTIRFYEDIGFITKPTRLPNGYRVFTQLHVDQVCFCRTALRAEVLQNGLRDTAVAIIRLCAACDFSSASQLTQEYLMQIDRELAFAKGAIRSVEAILAHRTPAQTAALTRGEAASALGVTHETLRNWERNGLASIRRLPNGYRAYTPDDMERLLIIRTLRCANYSLSAILRLTGRLSGAGELPVQELLDQPDETEEIVSVCDHLLSSLSQARDDALSMDEQLQNMQNI